MAPPQPVQPLHPAHPPLQFPQLPIFIPPCVFPNHIKENNESQIYR
jgi:hypothetical protein